MALRDLTDRAAVIAAMTEATELGEEEFLAKYGFGPSRRHRIAHDGRTYPSKAILGAAHQVQFPDQGPLRPSDFSGGEETIMTASQLGFDVVSADSPDDIALALRRFLALFAEARTTKFGGDHPAVAAIRAAARAITDVLPPPLANADVRPSVGQGNWAAVPWIAVLDPRITRTTQQGVYPVLLFDQGLSGVELTIAQGVTQLKQSLGRPGAVAELTRRAEALRSRLAPLAEHGFKLDADFSLGDSPLGRDYVASTIVHRRFALDDLDGAGFTEALQTLLEAYGNLVDAGELDDLDGPHAKPSPQALLIYLSQAAEARFEAAGRGGAWGWSEPPEGLEMLRPGDLVAFGRGLSGRPAANELAEWLSRELRELVVGRVAGPVERTDEQAMPEELAGGVVYPWKLRFNLLGSRSSVALGAGQQLSEAAVDALRQSAVSGGSGHLVPVAGSPVLEAFLTASDPSVTPNAVAAAATAFLDGVAASGVRLSDDLVLAFFAALAAKPFAILTGLSGSGKTQLAMRLGDWLGSDDAGRPRFLLVPVRPDWTGPEYLFGYRDVLRSSAEGEVWAVPDALEFILRAHNEPDEPYLLVLDEMNLAHVERYFADFLSGIESRQPILPELSRDESQWRATGNAQRLPLPRNLIVVGTVNVDETTYLFSPKVLDRAFTFEFRTSADELDPALGRPTSLASGEPAHRRTIVRLLADDAWHRANASPSAEAIFADLKALHALLSPSSHEFGHRVLHEALRFAAFLHAVGLSDRWRVLDWILLTKLLPKMHGTRARVEQPLRDLLEFAMGGAATEIASARMPRSASKLDRMLKVLLQAQFVSFTE